jgi:hypothetical protein
MAPMNCPLVSNCPRGRVSVYFAVSFNSRRVRCRDVAKTAGS